MVYVDFHLHFFTRPKLTAISITLTAFICLFAQTAHAISPYPAGFIWNRSADWSGGQIPGTVAGNPDDDQLGQAVWTYGYVNSTQALGSSTPWYLENINLSVWDDAWFSQAGGWVFDDNVGPVIQQDSLSLIAGQNRSVIIKWQNPTLEDQRINITGSVRLHWNQSAGGNAEGNIEIAILRQQIDGSLEPLFIQSRHSDEGNNPIVEIDVRNIALAASEQILFAYRGAPVQRWVDIYDDLLSITLANQGYQLHVSTTGNDNNDGTAPANALATLQGARDKIRELRQDPSPLDGKDVEVIFANGVYPINQTVLFDDVVNDSGAPGNPVIYRSENPGQAFLEGGRNLTELVPGLSWSQHNGDIYVADVGALEFNSLFVNGGRAVRARTPNVGFLPIITSDPDVYAVHDGFKYSPGDINPAWVTSGDVEIVSYHKWLAWRHQVASVDAANSFVYMQGDTPIVDRVQGFNFGNKLCFDPSKPDYLTCLGGSEGARYYVENLLAAIDTAGEWYLDRSAGKLYFQKYPGQSISEHEFVVPVLETFIDSDASHVIFQDLTFRYSDWSMPVGGYNQSVPSGSNEGVTRSIVLAGNNQSFLNNTVSNTGGWALSSQGDKARIVGNKMVSLGAGGVLIDDVANANTNTWVYGNTILYPGEIWEDAAGLVLNYSKRNHIVSNEISCAPYSGLVSQTPPAATGLDGFNLIQHNNIHNVMRTLTDGGGIYLFGSQLGTVVQANRIKDIFQTGGLNDSYFPNQFQMGLYLDGFGEGITMRENLVVNTGFGFLSNGDAGNSVRNNIFVNASYRGIHLNSKPLSDLMLQSNVVAWTEPNTNDDVWIVYDQQTQSGQITDSNLFEYSMVTNIAPDSLTNFGSNAIVNVNPQFVDPAQGDYRLQPSSPALTLLTVPIQADWLVNDLGQAAIPDVSPPGDACDTFPLDPAEWLDNDGDGTGNNADLDDDNDGLLDSFETTYGFDPLVAGEQTLDGDADGLDNLAEQAAGTDPTNADTDGDGVSDGDEVSNGTDPLTPDNAGDVAPRGNPNGVLNAADALVMQRLLLGLITPTPIELVVGDLNNNGGLDIGDLLLLERAVLGLTP